jgi:hypothetical protein
MNHDAITVNVGGKIFQTSKRTLEQAEYFKNLFEMGENLRVPVNDTIFVDRDPDGFKYVLNFLRDVHYKVPYQYEYELKFYLVEYNSENLTKMPLVTTVKLNVGGTIFETSLETIGQSRYLQDCYNSLCKEKDILIFIDRDPKKFAPLLEFMRKSTDTIPHYLVEEAKYYQIKYSWRNFKYLPSDTMSDIFSSISEHCYECGIKINADSVRECKNLYFYINDMLKTEPINYRCYCLGHFGKLGSDYSFICYNHRHDITNKNWGSISMMKDCNECLHHNFK